MKGTQHSVENLKIFKDQNSFVPAFNDQDLKPKGVASSLVDFKVHLKPNIVLPPSPTHKGEIQQTIIEKSKVSCRRASRGKGK